MGDSVIFFDIYTFREKLYILVVYYHLMFFGNDCIEMEASRNYSKLLMENQPLDEYSPTHFDDLHECFPQLGGNNEKKDKNIKRNGKKTKKPKGGFPDIEEIDKKEDDKNKKEDDKDEDDENKKEKKIDVTSRAGLPHKQIVSMRSILNNRRKPPVI